MKTEYKKRKGLQKIIPEIWINNAIHILFLVMRINESNEESLYDQQSVISG